MAPGRRQARVQFFLGGRRQFLISLIVTATGLLALAVSQAAANDMWLSDGGPGLGWFLLLLGFAGIYFYASFLAYVAAMVLVEAWVLSAVLKLRYGQAFAYCFIANLVSTLIGLLWYSMAGQIGWKTAFLHGEYERWPLLMVRSFLVTLAIELAVLILLLRDRKGARAILSATAAANAVSYVLTAVIVLVGVIFGNR